MGHLFKSVVTCSEEEKNLSQNVQEFLKKKYTTCLNLYKILRGKNLEDMDSYYWYCTPSPEGSKTEKVDLPDKEKLNVIAKKLAQDGPIKIQKQDASKAGLLENSTRITNPTVSAFYTYLQTTSKRLAFFFATSKQQQKKKHKIVTSFLW